MGKIVKYCAACDESFAEKFAFCPNCGKGMQAFEMNPMAGGASIAAEKATVGAANGNGFKAETNLPDFTETPVEAELPIAAATAAVLPAAQAQTVAEKVETVYVEPKAEVVEEVKPEIVEEAQPEIPFKETKTFAASASGGSNNSQTSSDGYRTVESRAYKKVDSGFNLTVIEETNGKQRNVLLLGSLLFIMSLAMGGMVYSLFNNNISIAAIGEESGLSIPITDEVPMVVEETPKPKDDKDAGGGGGGGREEKTETSQGRLATQTEKPIIAPDKSIVQKDFELKQPVASTQGNKVIKPTDQPYGDPNSRSTLSSNGIGVGGGQGSGIGTGQGSGRGTGAGSGIGSGFGSGEGDGIGGGRGSGSQGSGNAPPPPEIKPPPVGPTLGVNIIAKPRANYTDAARQNQVQGTVTLRVTFTANGQIGSISPVSGLPYGLTEQAIAAARSIKFEPAKKNGVPQTVTKQVQYSFTIY